MITRLAVYFAEKGDVKQEFDNKFKESYQGEKKNISGTLGSKLAYVISKDNFKEIVRKLEASR